jgi:sugar/nucleoside kinase (ribokinase family)
MTTASAATEPLDLVVVGGLTVDRFADSDAPGGSVVHIARALGPRGVRIGVVTVAGAEAAAQRGVAELRRSCAVVEVASAPRSVTFRHDEAAGERRLSLEQRGGQVPLADLSRRFAARATLYAPVADEVAIEWLAGHGDRPVAGAILQGWLRDLGEGGEVVPRRMGDLSPALRAGLGALDLLVASREDLRAGSDQPAEQVAAVRAAVGPGPALVVTCGLDGAWIAAPADRGGVPRRLSVPWPVDGVSTVGAGDVFAAAMLAGGWHDPGRVDLDQRVADAMRTVAEVLERRRRG